MLSLYFSQMMTRLLVVSLIVLGGARVIGALRPDGGVLSYQSFRFDVGASGVALVDLNRRQPFDLLQAGILRYYVWSPDGSQIAYVSRNFSRMDVLSVYDLATTRRYGLMTDARSNFFPSWSPDGSQITFMRFRRNYDIFVIGADGRAQRVLTDHAANDSLPQWSPDGTRIAFVSDRDSAFRRLYVMSSTGDDVRLLSPHPVTRAAAWSPNGAHLAFMTEDDGDSEVYRVDVDGANRLKLTDNARGDWNPVWSPDGSQIAFVSNRDGAGSVFVMNADGSGQRRLTDTARDDMSPVWSPDGARIAFVRLHESPNSEIYVVPAAGGAAQRITNNSARDLQPAWMP